MAHSRPSSVRELLNDAVRYFYFARKVPAASSALLGREIFFSVVVHTRDLTQTAKTHIKVLVFRTIMSYRSNIAYRGIRIWARNTLRRIKWLNGEFFKRQKSARPNIKQRMFRDTEWKHRLDLIHFKRFVCIHRCWNFSLDSSISSTNHLFPRLSLCFVSTFIRSFICMNSNYVERLSAVSAQTRILLPLEDEINARPINSTLPSSLPLSAFPTSHPAVVVPPILAGWYYLIIR